jgi:hypothetical protein
VCSHGKTISAPQTPKSLVPNSSSSAHQLQNHTSATPWAQHSGHVAASALRALGLRALLVTLEMYRSTPTISRSTRLDCRLLKDRQQERSKHAADRGGEQHLDRGHVAGCVPDGPSDRGEHGLFIVDRNAGLKFAHTSPLHRVTPGIVRRAAASRSGLPLEGTNMDFILWIIAVILVISGIFSIFRGQLIWGIVLIVVGLLVGPGGVSIFHTHHHNHA